MRSGRGLLLHHSASTHHRVLACHPPPSPQTKTRIDRRNHARGKLECRDLSVYLLRSLAVSCAEAVPGRCDDEDVAAAAVAAAAPTFVSPVDTRSRLADISLLTTK